MTSAMSRIVPIALIFAAMAGGCTSMSHVSNCDGQDGCKPPRKWSDEWWAIEADKPVGARQKFKKGKLWPPYPRPTEDQQPIRHRYHAAHYWPHPYNCQDRRYVNDVTERQVANGWMLATTLYYYHFDAEQGGLNHSGEMQLRWILENAPEDRRVVWVQTGNKNDESHERLADVQLAVADIVGDDKTPPIMLRVTTPYGRPAQEIDHIRNTEIATMPEPRVKYQALPTGGS